MKRNEEDVFIILSKLLGISLDKVKTIKQDEDLKMYGMTSISCIKLVVALEEKYMFCLNDEDLLFDKLNTFQKIFDILENYVE